MTNAKPNLAELNVFAERDELQRENEQLRREYNRLSGQNRATEEINVRMQRQNETLRAELEAARAVADAAVAYMDCDDENDADRWLDLSDAVREYRADADDKENNGKTNS